MLAVTAVRARLRLATAMAVDVTPGGQYRITRSVRHRRPCQPNGTAAYSGVSRSPSGRGALPIRGRGQSAWWRWPPGGAAGRYGLPDGARDIGGDDVAGVPVQAAPGPVVPHRGPRISMRCGLLRVAQRHPGVQTGSERFTSHAEWVIAERAGGRHSSGLVMTGSCQFSRV